MTVDQANPQDHDEQESGGEQDNSAERQRSTIKFPYGDLDDAIKVAESVHAVGGTSCEMSQISAHMGMKSSTSGAFKQKMLTAKTFGLVSYTREKVTLTSLGSNICDPKKVKRARSEAFLTVPLYKTVYEKFKDGVLPGTTGLEAEMEKMGVAKKQTDKARQYFHRSATQAGFFWSGQDRLVKPKGLHDNGSASEEVDAGDGAEQQGHKKGGDGGGDDSGLHPFIVGLLKELPKATEKNWPITKRAQWLQLAAVAFNMIYTDSDSAGEIEVRIKGSES